MKWQALVLTALLATGCTTSENGDSSSSSPKGDAPMVQYGQLASKKGERVKTVAWVLGEGGSFRFDGTFVLIIVPDASLNWVDFFDYHDSMEKLVTSLDGDPERIASAADVDEYMKYQRAVSEFNAQVRAVESSPDAIAWGHFKQNVLGARYDMIGDTPRILVRPTRKELRDEANKVWERYKQIAKSVEIEAIGTAMASEEWAKRHNADSNLQSAVSEKQIVIEVESYKVLRTARDAAKGPQTRGAESLEKPLD
jgi:hypothetical protein